MLFLLKPDSSSSPPEARHPALRVAKSVTEKEPHMVDATLNIPEVIAEVSDLFERYEQALLDRDVGILDATFWDSPHTIRYAPNQRGYGFDAIHAHRMAGSSG